MSVFDHGYRFAVRYVRRDKAHVEDLDASETALLLDAGLGLMLVQHVESETAWTPSAEKGSTNGETAASEASRSGIPQGVSVWCDLEGVASGTPASVVIDYCNRWHQAVASSVDTQNRPLVDT